MAKNKKLDDAAPQERVQQVPDSKRLGVGAIIGITAAGVVVLLGTAAAGGVAGAAIALNALDDRPGIEELAEGDGRGGENRGQLPGDRDGMKDGMRGGYDHDWDDDDDDDARDGDSESDRQRGPGGMNRDGMNRDGSPNAPQAPSTAPDRYTGAS